MIIIHLSHLELQLALGLTPSDQSQGSPEVMTTLSQFE